MSQPVDYRTLRKTEAENYARDFVPLIPAPLAADLIDTAAPEPGEYAVDVACGTGVVTRLLAERVGATGKVVGIDLTPEMVEVARDASAAHGSTIEWLQADAQALPLADESHDLLVCQLGLMFFPDRHAAIREMHRVLSPGGRVVINVPAPTRTFDIMGEALGRHIDPALPVFLRQIFSLGEPELRALLDDTGFRHAVTTTTIKPLRLPPPAEFLWQYLAVTPIAERVLAADQDRRRAFEDEVVAGWQDYADDTGLLLELPVITVTARK